MFTLFRRTLNLRVSFIEVSREFLQRNREVDREGDFTELPLKLSIWAILSHRIPREIFKGIFEMPKKGRDFLALRSKVVVARCFPYEESEL